MMAANKHDTHESTEGAQDRGLTSEMGPVVVDWPRTVGYYSGITLALAFELIEPPLAIFIAAIPILKMLNRPKAPLPMRMVSQLLEGAAKPVGGDSSSTIQLNTAEQPATIGPGRGRSRGTTQPET
jgi:hypothetical protein